jgi:hypothetical protein
MGLSVAGASEISAKDDVSSATEPLHPHNGPNVYAVLFVVALQRKQ